MECEELKFKQASEKIPVDIFAERENIEEIISDQEKNKDNPRFVDEIQEIEAEIGQDNGYRNGQCADDQRVHHLDAERENAEFPIVESDFRNIEKRQRNGRRHSDPEELQLCIFQEDKVQDNGGYRQKKHYHDIETVIF